MIANVSPTNTSCEHSFNTLRYADRVKGEVYCTPLFYNFPKKIQEGRGKNKDIVWSSNIFNITPVIYGNVLWIRLNLTIELLGISFKIVVI